MEKTKLLVMANFKDFKKSINEDGGYGLIHPQYYVEKNEGFFGHWCSSLAWAFKDLQYTNRKEFLNIIFGADNWEFEHYEYVSDVRFDEDMKNFQNPKIDTETIVNLFKEFKEKEKHI